MRKNKTVERMLAKNQKKQATGFLVVSVFIIALLANAQPITAQEKSFLWKIQSEKNSLYLLGSIHFLKKENYPLKKSIEEVFEKSKKIVFEIDLQGATPEKAQRVTLEKGIYRDGTTLQQNLTPETYNLAQERAAQLGIDLRPLSPLKPWAVGLTMMALKLQKLGFDSRYGIDRYLANRAKDNNMPAEGLETLESQIGLLDQFSRREQESMLHQTLKELEQLDQSVEGIVQSWVMGDVKSVEKLLLEGMRKHPKVYQKIIVERNQRWLPQIKRLLVQGDKVMVVVGAAHLVGPDGIIELLKGQGYTVEQL
jgi:uncharacterized protein